MLRVSALPRHDAIAAGLEGRQEGCEGLTMIRKKRTRPRARALFRPSEAEPRSGQPVAMGGVWLVVGYCDGRLPCVLAGLATRAEALEQARLFGGGSWRVAVERSA